MKAADRLGTGGSFGSLSRSPRSERGRAKAQAEGTIPDYEIQRLPLARVAPCPMNPRRYYGTEEQREKLGQSLAKKQTTACVAVTRAAYLNLWPAHELLIGTDDDHVLLNGERRWRSATQVGLEALDFVVRDDLATSQADFMDYLMAENEDREDFTIIERALGLKQLLDACGGTAAEVARRRGRDRSWVGNQILLLSLPSAIQDLLASGEMAERYGRRLARAYKDDQTLTVEDLLALEEQLKEEERAKRIAQRDALKMLSADNNPPAAEASPVGAPGSGSALSADNTSAAAEVSPTGAPRSSNGLSAESTAVQSAEDREPTSVPQPSPIRRDSSAVLSADNTAEEDGETLVGGTGAPGVLSADNTPAVTVPSTVPRQVSAQVAATPAQLVRALGETASQQAETLRAGLDAAGLLALMHALRAHV
ncbi:ParB/RepB/Spo0J family partition protein [Kitasatospora sp. NPDC088351]|uniref:ParB/RepB/Spo0J family partition protein n=1 Tax=Kitasatospora sp. NPDC088351 TaxID=3155180 RepID=UPI00343060A2